MKRTTRLLISDDRGDGRVSSAGCLDLEDAGLQAEAEARDALAAVRSLVGAQQLARAADLARDALATPLHPSDRIRFALVLSDVLFNLGDTVQSMAVAGWVLHEPELPESSCAAAQVGMAGVLLAQDDVDGARTIAESLLSGDSRAGDAGVPSAIGILAFIAWREGRTADAMGMLRATARRQAQRERVPSRHHTMLGLAVMLTATGDFDGAAAVIDAARDDIARSDGTWVAAPAILRGRLYLAAGRPQAAADLARAGVAAADLGARILVPLARLLWAQCALLRGDVDEASRQVRGFRAAPVSGRILFASGSYTYTEARLAAEQCGPERAIEILADTYDDPSGSKQLFMEEPGAAAWLVRTALSVGDSDRAAAVAACMTQLAADNRNETSLVAAAAHASGVLGKDPASLLLAAAAHVHPWASASAREDAGEALAARCDASAARDALEQTQHQYVAVGAERDAARVRRRLRRLASLRNGRPVSGWTALTSTERRVARVVAEGLSNPQVGKRLFLSRHTVDFHLRQIFRKLSIHSRVELTRYVIECDPN
ncbi:MAG: hypothetical protein QOE35_1958 [Actinomycetota bacterium]|jgi:ATP/maltotriose-dependent transcriptional regulator MalT